MSRYAASDFGILATKSMIYKLGYGEHTNEIKWIGNHTPINLDKSQPFSLASDSSTSLPIKAAISTNLKIIITDSKLSVL